jgi:hypothetical protein
MSKTPSLTPKELIKLLEQKGFVFDRSKDLIRFILIKKKDFA